MLANHTWHLVIQEGKQSLIRSCLVFFSFLKLALNHSSMKSSISRVNKTQIWSGINCVDYFLLLLECISYFSSTCLTSTCSHTLTHAHTRSHTSAGTHTYSPFLCITLLLLCPELTVQAQQNHRSYTQPAGSLEVPVSHTPTSSLLLAVLTPSFSSLSYTRRHTPSLPYTHTHTQSSPPSSRTYCLDRGRSFY